MRILFLSPRQPLPTRSGAKLREYHFLRALGKRAEVTYVYFADAGAAALTTTDLPFCREVVAVPKPPAYTASQTVRGILGRWPLTVLNYTSAAMDEAVARAAESREFDIVHADGIHMIRYVRAAAARQSGLKAIYNWHNIDSEVMHRYAETTASRGRGWYAGQTAVKLELLEGEILREARGHVVCSERERAQLLELAPQARIAVVENGVDTAYFAGAGAGASFGEGAGGRRHVVFVGAMDYFPNSEAAVYFAREVWGRVRSRLGGAELVIVGANPGAEVLALGELPGVRVAGMVPDVRPYYGQALAAVVPLRTGGGTRLKILEAMAAGVPVVSTPLGAEGLDVTDGVNALLVEPGDAEGWAEKLGGLMDSEERRAGMTEAGLELVRTRYDWEILGAKLRDTYEGWAGGE